MNELSLFTGAGGGVLGTTLMGWRAIGYVEWDQFCQQVIAARIRDGILPSAPIFGDVREFIQSGAAAEYRGFADVVTAGFPCQPFSVAGRQRGRDDSRNMWPATIECIRLVRPGYALLENVPGLLTSGYFGTVLGDLAESGYDARWRILSAAELGAPHKRDRLWIVANDASQPARCDHAQQGQRQIQQSGIGAGAANVADTDSFRCDGGAAVAGGDGTSAGGQGDTGAQRWSAKEFERGGREIPDTSTAGLAQRIGTPGERAHAATARGDWWAVEPGLGRVADGVADRVERLKALGNGQVPAVVRAAWMLLSEEIEP